MHLSPQKPSYHLQMTKLFVKLYDHPTYIKLYDHLKFSVNIH